MKVTQRGFTIIEVMIVVAIMSLLAAMIIPSFLKTKSSANEAAAQSTLKTIAVALENYFSVNSSYPSSTDDLLGVEPPYLNQDYFVAAYNGYTYTADDLTSSSYIILAEPVDTNHGTKSFTISTGGILAQN